MRGNPVNLTDPGGRIAPLLLAGAAALVGGLVGGIIGAAGDFIHQLQQNGGNLGCIDGGQMLREGLKGLIAGAAGGLAFAAAVTGAIGAAVTAMAGVASSLAAWAGGVLTAAATKAFTMITGMVTSKAAATFVRFAIGGGAADYAIQRLLQGKGENDVDWGSVLHSAVKGGLFGNWVVTLGASQYIAPHLTNYATQFVWYAAGGAAINSGMAAITGKPRRGERTIFNAIADGISGFAPAFYVLSDGLVSEVISNYESLLFGEEARPFSYKGGLTNWLQTKLQ